MAAATAIDREDRKVTAMLDDNAGSGSFDRHDLETGGAVNENASPHARRSLWDDLSHLANDGKTYVQAELAFQKTRLAFSAEQAKGILLFGIGALIAVHLALIALAVGLIIALTPLLTGWGATALVTIVLLAMAAFCGLRAIKQAKIMMSALKKKPS